LLLPIGNWDINATLQTLESDDKINIISKPSISTLDNHTAYVESGTEIPYQTSSDNNGTETEFKKAVLRLEVTPHVIDNNILKMAIFASKDEPDAEQANNDGEPAILTRKSETTLLLRDGQTTVIAGLVETQNRDVESGVPFLMDIPYLGYLFKSRATGKKFDDLLIFVTPHILNKTAVNADIAQKSRKRNVQDVAGVKNVIPKPLRIESEQMLVPEEQTEDTLNIVEAVPEPSVAEPVDTVEVVAEPSVAESEDMVEVVAEPVAAEPVDTVEAVPEPVTPEHEEAVTELDETQEAEQNQTQLESPVAEPEEAVTELDESQEMEQNQSQLEDSVVEQDEVITEIDKQQNEVLKQSQVESIIVEINSDSQSAEEDDEPLSYAVDEPEEVESLSYAVDETQQTIN